MILLDSKNRDGSGFDIRSVGPVDPETGVAPVRRIEVKGRAQGELEVSLTVNEWRKAQQLGDSYSYSKGDGFCFTCCCTGDSLEAYRFE